jgi:chorismate-pyruvate lyase
MRTFAAISTLSGANVVEPAPVDRDHVGTVGTVRAPVFDPASDLFVAQFGRPPDLQPVNMRALSPFHRALLVIDGTVTTFLEAYTLEPIEVVRLGQAVQPLTEENPWLELAAGASVLARNVRLEGRYTHRLYAQATSLIALDRLPPDIVSGLDVEGGGLGRILNGAKAENRREILWYGRERSDHLKEQSGGSRHEFIVRTYRIIQGGQPIMLISEKFPTDEPGQPSHE